MLWFILVASSPCLLCSTSYITNCVVITDVTFLMVQAASTQEAGVILQRVGKSTGPRIKTSGSDAASVEAPFPKKLDQSYPTLLCYFKWSTKLEITIMFRVLKSLMWSSEYKIINMVPSCRGRGYPWKLFFRPRCLPNSSLNPKDLSARKVIWRKLPHIDLVLKPRGFESIMLVRNRMFLGRETQWLVKRRSGLSVASRTLRNEDSSPGFYHACLHVKELVWVQAPKVQGWGRLQSSKGGGSGELCFNFDSFSNLILGRSFSP